MNGAQSGSLAISALFSSSESTRLPSSLGMLPNCIRGTLQMGSPASSEGYIAAFNKIRTDIGDPTDGGVAPVRLVVVDSLAGRVEGGEADDDNVDVGLPAGFAFPGKRAMRQSGFSARGSNRIGQRTPGCSPWVIEFVETKATRIRVPCDVLSGMQVPAAHVVQERPFR